MEGHYQAEDFHRIYAEMSEDELLHVAADMDQLRPEARDAIQVELRSRSLQSSDLVTYVADTAPPPPGPKTKPLSRNFRGTGLIAYGRRAFRSDGSFVTTQWIAFGGVPLVPFATYRVIKKSIFQNEIVLERTKIDTIQVLYVYNYVAALALIGLLMVRRNLWREFYVFLPVVALPWIMRTYTRRKSRADRELH